MYFTKGIEVGHIFQLGEKYSQAMGATFLDENGKSKPFIMGCYGIGISRLLAAIIEQHYDEKGMKWTKATAPFFFFFLISKVKDCDQVELATRIYHALSEQKIECLLDDRNERYGAKMADFELIGMPYALIVGKGIQEGKVELVCRANLEKTIFEVNDFEGFLESLCAILKI